MSECAVCVFAFPEGQKTNEKFLRSKKEVEESKERNNLNTVGSRLRKSKEGKDGGSRCVNICHTHAHTTQVDTGSVSRLDGVFFFSTTPRGSSTAAAVDGRQRVRVRGQSNLPAPFPISFDLLLAAVFAGGRSVTAAVAARWSP